MKQKTKRYIITSLDKELLDFAKDIFLKTFL